MNSITPKVSIIIPIYNVEKYLRECLNSVINQTLKEIEIICVNDGSTDSSTEILIEYAEKDNRIKVISKPNSGYGHTMNVGIDAATGEYIGIVESDDYVKLDMYETLYNIAKKNDLDVVRADFERFVGEGKERKFTYGELTKDKSYYNKVLNPWEDIKVFTFAMMNWTGIYKRHFLNKYHIRHNETPGASYQDNGFWFQVFCRASKIYFLDKPLYQVRRDNPNSSIFSKSKVFCMCDEYDFIKTFLDNNPDIKKRFIYIYSLKRFHNYMFTYNRIAEDFKLMFLRRFSRDFKLAMENGEIDKKLFSVNEWITLNQIIRDPVKFHIKTSFKKKLRLIERYKMGQKFLWILRKIKGGVRCYKENGLKYTLIRFKEKAINKFCKSKIKKDYHYYKNLDPQKYPQELCEWYKKVTGKKLNLQNPQTFNEKIQWLKLYDSTPIKTMLADKYLVREWVNEKIGEEYLIPLLGVWDKFDDIDFDKLPEKFVLKANHGCGWNIIVKDKNNFNINDAKKKFDVWMNTNYAFKNGLELHYKNIAPKIIAEKYIENDEGLLDYKFLCFNGKVKYVWVDTDRFTAHKRDIFDLDWNHLPFTIKFPNAKKTPGKPKRLKEMIELATELSKGFAHVRVDFYEVDSKIYFGEVTFTSGSGIEKFCPEEYDLKLGQMIELPNKAEFDNVQTN